jgi:hypothetical protein
MKYREFGASKDYASIAAPHRQKSLPQIKDYTGEFSSVISLVDVCPPLGKALSNNPIFVHRSKPNRMSSRAQTRTPCIQGTGSALLATTLQNIGTIHSAPQNSTIHRMQPHHTDRARSFPITILSDLHFWVPLGVLIGGLLLLHSIH